MIAPANHSNRVISRNQNLSNSPQTHIPHRHPLNPYRRGSKYGLCFDIVSAMAQTKPVTRKALLKAYSKVSGKDEKHARYDLGIILSPTKEGDGHRSSRKYAYWVERFENSAVKLHICNEEERI